MGGTVPSLEEAANAILSEVPDQLGAIEGVRHVDATPLPGRCAAIDGGSTVILDAKTTGVYSVRAGYVIREPSDIHLLRITTQSSRTATRRGHAHQWDTIRKQYAWGVEIEAPTWDTDRIVPQLTEAERVLAEYDATRRALHELSQGDLVLLDGSLDQEERFAAIRRSLLDRTQDVGCAVAAVSKDTGRSLGGVLPFTLELEEIALRQGAQPPWFVDVTEAFGLMDAPYRVLGVQFDARATPYRVDVAGGGPAAVVAFLASLCNDAAYAGYPYPLARIHQRVHFESGEAMDLRRELEAIVARRRGHRLSVRLFGRGRDVLELAE